MTEINVNLGVIAQNRKPISMVGANLGAQYFKAETRSCDPDFVKRQHEVKAGGDINLILNREVRRYRLTGHDILSVQVGTDATGSTKVYLNKGMDAEVSVPVTTGMEKIGIVAEEAIAKALRGDKSIIFSDATKLATLLNTYNQDEKTRLQKIVAECNKMIDQLDSAINENVKKAENYQREVLESTPSTVPVGEQGGSVVIIND